MIWMQLLDFFFSLFPHCELRHFSPSIYRQCVPREHNSLYIEDIYSFAVNTINIVIEYNENISIFTSAKHE